MTLVTTPSYIGATTVCANRPDKRIFLRNTAEKRSLAAPENSEPMNGWSSPRSGLISCCITRKTKSPRSGMTCKGELCHGTRKRRPASSYASGSWLSLESWRRNIELGYAPSRYPPCCGRRERRRRSSLIRSRSCSCSCTQLKHRCAQRVCTRAMVCNNLPTVLLNAS